jgi:hypothetical protein
MSYPPREKEGFRRRKWEETLSSTTAGADEDASIDYLARQMTVTIGSLVAGTVAETQVEDDTYTRIDGIVSATEINVGFTIPRVNKFNSVVFNGHYIGSATMNVELYNSITSSWVALGSMTNGAVDNWYTYGIEDSGPYIDNSGIAQLRIRDAS